MPTVAVSLLVLALAFLAVPAGQASVPVPDVGWWTDSPAPPTVPSGGIGVGRGANGRLAIGALRLAVEGGASGTVLHLAEAGGQGGPLAALRACPTDDRWSAAAGEPLARAPRDACARASAALVRADDGTWTGDVQALVAGAEGEVSLVVVPDPAASPAAPFQLAFGPPRVDGSTAPARSPDGTSTTTTTTEATAATTTTAPVAEDDGDTGAGNESAFAAPLPATSPFAAVATEADAAVGEDEPATVGPVPYRVARPALASSARHHVTRATVAGWVLLASLVGAAAGALHWARFTRVARSGSGV